MTVPDGVRGRVSIIPAQPRSDHSMHTDTHMPLHAHGDGGGPGGPLVWWYDSRSVPAQKS